MLFRIPAARKLGREQELGEAGSGRANGLFFFAPAPVYAPLVGGKALCTQAIGHVAAQFCYGVP